ncbi:MAG TPA: hypothetical protein EYQ64_09190 [Gemmatimonadetes bacterium]|jgi:hypothetical protein|nr:hypothetical protein [Gemmatimonadota bacterium]
MGFWDLTWRYLVFFLPLYGVYLLGVRRAVAPPRLLSVLFSGGNVGFLGYLVYLGAQGGLGVLRSVAYTTGTMFIVVGPVVILMVVAAGRSDRSKERTPGE